MTKYVFVTGGVVSGLGKGITASSIALLLKSRGYKVFMQKFDPYFNVNPENMNPLQHGEVFVTHDGCVTDLDLGHYERFIDEELNYSSNITSGKIYSQVIEKGRNGDYFGATVQMVPHITDEIKKKINEAGISSKADIVITEIGGTVGDIESQPFIEALRQVQYELGKKNTFFVHCTLIPYLFGSWELKTKPTQNSVKELRNMGILPDSLICRAPFDTGVQIKTKLSLFCSIPINNIIDSIDVKNIYQIPINYYNQKIDTIILKQFELPVKKANIKYWRDLINTVDSLEEEIEISLVGKYVELHDAYLSVYESLAHGGYKHNRKININWINSEILEKKNANLDEIFKNSKGIIVPGSSGIKKIKGELNAIKYARENNIPFLGIDIGMQLSIIEFARNVCNIDCNSTEFDSKTKNPIIDAIKNEDITLGNVDCYIKNNTLAYSYYKKNNIKERHKNKYEFNNKYTKILEENGLILSGINKQLNIAQIIENPNNDFFVACLFHPEFKSRPTRPHPLFDGFIKASISK